MKKWLKGWSKGSQAMALICVGVVTAMVVSEVETDGIRLFGRWRHRVPAQNTYQPPVIEYEKVHGRDLLNAEKASEEMHTEAPKAPIEEIPMDKPQLEVDPASMAVPYVAPDHVEKYTDGQGDAEADLKAARKELNQARKKMKAAAERAGVEWPVKKEQVEKVMSATSDAIPDLKESREPAQGTATLDNISVYAVEQELVAYTNALRIKHGLAPLIVDQKLMDSARKHAIWMTGNGMQHGSSNGVWNGEIIAAGQRTARDAVNAWISSPPHYGHLINRNHRYIGMTGYTRGGQVYWCGQFK